MKFMNKKLLAVLVLCGVTSIAFGYDFTFNNKTNKAVAVKLNLAASTTDFDDMAVIAPGKPYKFSFTGFKSGFCLSKISYGFITTESATQNYPTFIEASKYTTVSVGELTTNACQSLAFDITQYGDNVILAPASE